MHGYLSLSAELTIIIQCTGQIQLIINELLIIKGNDAIWKLQTNISWLIWIRFELQILDDSCRLKFETNGIYFDAVIFKSLFVVFIVFCKYKVLIYAWCKICANYA